MSDLAEFLKARIDDYGGTLGHAIDMILARYEDCLARMEDDDYPAGVARDQAREYEDFVLPNLAAVYSDHPDYDAAEWAP